MRHRLQDYGLYQGAVMDVCTRFVFTLSMLPTKLAAVVYTVVEEPALRAQGVPIKLTTDKGREFDVVAFAVRLAHGLANTGAPGHVYVPSKRNVRIERFWGQVNVMINLPMKLMLLWMESNNVLNVDSTRHVGAIQALALPMMQFACNNLRLLWNEVQPATLCSVCVSLC